MKQRTLFLFLLIFSIVAVFGWQPGLAQTQNPIPLNTVDVRLYPEFNRPSMLVIYEITLDQDVPLPAEMLVQVPFNIQSLEIYNLAEDKEHIPVIYETFEIGQWQDIRFSSSTQKVKLEYYDPSLIKEDERRIFDFHWLSVHPVGALSITVRQPLRASPIQAEPAMDETIIGQDNIEYLVKAFGAVKSGELITLTMRYNRDLPGMATNAIKIEAASEINEDTPGRSASPMGVILWLLAGAVALLLIAGLYYYWFQTNIAKQPERVVQGVGILNLEKQVVFCHECGMRSRPEDSYCSNCGTELRRPTRFTEISRT